MFLEIKVCYKDIRSLISMCLSTATSIDQILKDIINEKELKLLNKNFKDYEPKFSTIF